MTKDSLRTVQEKLPRRARRCKSLQSRTSAQPRKEARCHTSVLAMGDWNRHQVVCCGNQGADNGFAKRKRSTAWLGACVRSGSRCDGAAALQGRRNGRSKWIMEVWYGAFRRLANACKEGRLGEQGLPAWDKEHLGHDVEAGVRRSRGSKITLCIASCGRARTSRGMWLEKWKKQTRSRSRVCV